MKKLYLAFLLALFSANSLLSSDIEPMYFEVDDVLYKTTSSIYEPFPSVEVVNGPCSEGAVEILDHVIYEGFFYEVTSIGNYAFSGCRSLESIKIPFSVTNIGERAFSGCTSLKSIEIPKSVTNIGEGAFYYCTSFSSIKIPISVTNIGKEAFSFCSGLTSIEIPISVTNIGDSAFGGCTGLTSITCYAENPPALGAAVFLSVPKYIPLYVPPSIVTLYQQADQWKDFNITGIPHDFNVGGLAYKIIPNKVPYAVEVTIKTPSYEGDVVIPENVTFKGTSYSVTSIGENAFYECTGLISIEIPNSVTHIGFEAFYGCHGLISIEIPYSVTDIGYNAFSFCHGLESIEVEMVNDYYSSDNGVLYNKEKTVLIRYPEGKVDDSYSIPNSVTSIGYNAFSASINLLAIEIPNSVTNIGSMAFSYCSGLTSIEIPSSVTKIFSGAFSDCRNLISINVDAANRHYSSDNGVLYDFEKTSLIQYPASKVGDRFTIPTDVTEVYYQAFEYSTGLSQIEIPNSVTDIGAWAFSNCSNLTSINIPNSVTSIGGGAFSGCNGLTSIKIPNSVLSIGQRTFLYCTGLTSIEIPSSVTYIGDNAFRGCNELISIKCYAENPPELGLFVYEIVPKAIPLYVPAGSVALYQTTKQWKDFNIVGITVEETFEVDDIGYKITSAEAPYSVEIISKMLGYEGDVVIPEQVIYEGTGYSVTSIGDRAFSGSNGFKSIENPQIVLKNGNAVNELSTGLTSIEIPKSVSNIGDGAFESCSSLLSITCHADTPPILGLDVFKNVPKDISLYVPASSVALYQQADQWKGFNIVGITIEENFEVDGIAYKMTSSESPYTVEVTKKTPLYEGDIVIPELIINKGISFLVTSIGNSAFSGCNGLTSVEIPNSVTDIGTDAFYLTTGLKSIMVDVTNVHYSSDAGVLYNKDKTSLIRYPQGKIGNSFKIPNSVTNIGYRAFSFCRSLKSIEIPNSVTDIGNWAIYACTGLTSIEIPNSVTNIGLDAFNSCNKITSIEIPNSVTSIGSNAFANCGSLTSVQISNSVTNIGSWAFSNCISLTSINVDNANEYYSSDAGVLYNKNKTVIIKYPVRKEGDVFVIPNSVTNIGKNAFDGCRSLTAIEIPNVVTNIGYHAFLNCSGLTSMTCYAENLPVLGSSVFWDVPKNIPLYVPAGSVALYQQADQWKEFNITPMVTTSRKNTTEINSNIDIFPNPVSDFLNIDLGGFHGEVSFEIFNAAGQFIFSGKVGSAIIINTRDFKAGIYIIKLNGDNWVETKRFVKK